MALNIMKYFLMIMGVLFIACLSFLFVIASSRPPKWSPKFEIGACVYSTEQPKLHFRVIDIDLEFQTYLVKENFYNTSLIQVELDKDFVEYNEVFQEEECGNDNDTEETVTI